MSDGLSVAPGSAKHVHFEQGTRESMVDIYVSTESLRVYDIPWVEDLSPSSPGPFQSQSKMSFVSDTSVKRSPYRWDCVLLGLLCLLLLSVIIYLAVQKNQEQDTCRNYTRQLEKKNQACQNLTERLSEMEKKLNNTIETFCGNPGGRNQQKCEELGY